MIVAFRSAKVALVFAAFSELSRSERRLFSSYFRGAKGDYPLPTARFRTKGLAFPALFLWFRERDFLHLLQTQRRVPR